MEPNHPALSISRQCELLGMPRASYYYAPVGVSEEDLELMRLIDVFYTRRPATGSRQMRDLLRGKGWHVGRDRVRRLMRTMGIEAIYPRKRRTTVASGDHARFPYLLRGLAIEKPNHVWCSDITYIPLQHGFVFLVAVMDWATRYVLSWRLSNTLDTSFCLEALDEALARVKPEIFNTDQGAQFTSRAFTDRLLSNGIAVSHDGRGRAYDNILIERLWRTVKYEEVYLHDYRSPREAQARLGDYFEYYNSERPHQSLAGDPPHMPYYEDPSGA